MLLSYREFGLEAELDDRVLEHLDSCDFCCAELQLLATCPPVDEEDSAPETMPFQLRRLAEEILSGSFLSANMLSETFLEKARLTYTDA